MTAGQLVRRLQERGLISEHDVDGSIQKLDSAELDGATLFEGYALRGGPEFLLRTLEALGIRPRVLIKLTATINDAYATNLSTTFY